MHCVVYPVSCTVTESIILFRGQSTPQSLARRSHGADMVHQLLVLHEAATTEVTCTRVPLYRCLRGQVSFFTNCSVENIPYVTL